MNVRHGFIFLVVGVFLIGCSSTQQTRSVKESGFLGKHYSLLREGRDIDYGPKTLRESQKIYINPETDWQAYNKVILTPVTIWKNKETLSVSPETLQYLANFMWAQMHEVLQPDYEMVQAPGPGVMRIAVAITEAEASAPVMDTLSSIGPLSLLTGAKGLVADGKPGFVGKASIEGRITDSQTGTLLGAAVDSRAGTKDLDGAMYEWNDVEKALVYWAKKLSSRLCGLRGGIGCKAPKA